MQVYKIEKNLPIPPSGTGRPKYPLRDMEVGDSFFVPVPLINTLKFRNRLSSALTYFGKRHSVQFITRSVDDGIRVWRVE